MRFGGADGLVELSGDFDFAILERVEVKEACFQAATAIAAVARSNAPVASGAYRASIGVEATRHGARVVADCPEASFVEFGVPHHGIPGRYVFHQAAASLGFKFGG